MPRTSASKLGLAAAALVGVLAASGARAESALGPTYPIAEPDLLDRIGARLRQLDASGALARLQQEQARRSADTVRHPAPLPGLRTGTKSVTRYYDPSFILERDVFDANGRLLFAAGTRKNPLEVVPMTRTLLFFDGRDSAQVARASALLTRFGERLKPILVAGSFLDLMRQWHVPVYYDQQARLVSRFGIVQVPALVSQEGMRLRIDELGSAP